MVKYYFNICFICLFNLKTTLGRRFLFDRITTVILIVKCSTLNFTTVHSQRNTLKVGSIVGIMGVENGGGGGCSPPPPLTAAPLPSTLGEPFIKI